MKSFTIAALLAAFVAANGPDGDECQMEKAMKDASYKGQSAAWGAEAAANAIKVNAVSGDYSLTGKTAINSRAPVAPSVSATKPATAAANNVK